VVAAARPKVKGGLGSTVTVLVALDAAEQQLGKGFPTRPEIEAQLRMALGDTFATLGLYDKAEAQLRRAAEVFAAQKDARGSRAADLALLLLRSERTLERGSDVRDRVAWLRDEAELAREVEERRRREPDYLHARAILRLAHFRLFYRDAFAEAEADFRECLDVLARIERDDGLVRIAQAGLGECLIGQKKYADAERVLIGCYEDMTRRAKSAPKEAEAIPVAVDLLVRLYMSWGKSEEAARWRAERAKYPPVTPPPPKKK
jgi:tetratricopeptide (TPR) repeat protein